MSEQEPGNDNSNNELDELERRIRAARATGPSGGPGDDDPGAPREGVGQALKVGAELLSGLIVGAGIGWFLDGWLGTRPWLMILFFFLGSGAGILNVYRSTGLIGKNDISTDDTDDKNENNPPDSKDLNG